MQFLYFIESLQILDMPFISRDYAKPRDYTKDNIIDSRMDPVQYRFEQACDQYRSTDFYNYREKARTFRNMRDCITLYQHVLHEYEGIITSRLCDQSINTVQIQTMNYYLHYIQAQLAEMTDAKQSLELHFSNGVTQELRRQMIDS